MIVTFVLLTACTASLLLVCAVVTHGPHVAPDRAAVEPWGDATAPSRDEGLAGPYLATPSDPRPGPSRRGTMPLPVAADRHEEVAPS